MLILKGTKAQVRGENITQTQEERNAGVLANWLAPWVNNTVANYPHILDQFQTQDMSIDTLPRPAPGTPAVIVGSGPSLDRSAPLLAEWDGVVFSTLSNARVCARWGHKPKYICNLDAGRHVQFLDDGFDWSGSTFLAHPSLHPDVLALWKQDIRYYIMFHLGHAWFDQVMPVLFGDYVAWPGKKPPNIRIAIFNAGCTLNNAIQIAHWLGYGPIFLIGADFGYPYKVVRCMGYRWNAAAARFDEQPPILFHTMNRPIHTANNGVLTTEEQIEYKKALLSIYRQDYPQLVDCSDGILTEFPKADFKEVVRNGGQGYEGLFRSREEIRTIVDQVLDGDSIKRLLPTGAPDRTGANAGSEDHGGL